jgi:UDP-2-acetamido-3-amino-2,3-dideoxy-glucuronate N-acetyltransferase
MGALSGVVESDYQKLDLLKKTYPNVQMFSKLDMALDYGFDGFVVATPAETHFKIAKNIIERGIHVLVEKPITLTKHDAEELVEISKRNKVNLMVGHVLLFHPAIRKIKEIIHSGKIGKLQYLYSNRLNLGAVRKEENILWSFAPHDISMFQYFINDKPRSVHSYGGAFIQPHLQDTTLTILKYENNIVGHIFVSWLHPFKEHRLVVIGSKGMLTFEDSKEEKKILFYEKGIDWIQGEPVKRDGVTEAIDYIPAPPLTEELKYFISHLDGSPVKISNGKNGVEVLSILEKATLCLKSTDFMDEKIEHSSIS